MTTYSIVENKKHMLIKKELEEEWLYTIKHFLHGFSEDYKNYILNKVDELTDILEKDITNDKEITSEQIRGTLEKIDDGMSNNQFDIILMLVYRYWRYSDKILYKYRRDDL